VNSLENKNVSQNLSSYLQSFELSSSLF